MQAMQCALALGLHLLWVDASVVALTSKGFDAALEANERVLVDFFAPWCHHCQELAPEYEEAAELAKGAGLRVLLGTLDVTEEPFIAKRFMVKSFPVLHYFVNGHIKATLSDETRTADTIFTWLRNLEIPPIQELTEDEKEDFVQLRSSPEAGNLGEFRILAQVKKQSARAKSYLAAVSEKLLDVQGVNLSFGVVWLSKLADAKADAKLYLLRPSFREPDATLVDYASAWSANNIAKWVINGMYATVGSGFDAKKYSAAAMETLNFEASVIALAGGPSPIASEGTEGDVMSARNLSFELQMAQRLLPLAKQYSPAWRFTVASVDDLGASDLDMLGAKKGAPLAKRIDNPWTPAFMKAVLAENMKAVLVCWASSLPAGGGGFSNTFDIPAYQREGVAAYKARPDANLCSFFFNLGSHVVDFGYYFSHCYLFL